ncbi:MAG: carboxypeptidase regulatory-like domain-containing protein [Vicinamibacterales bacterium]
MRVISVLGFAIALLATPVTALAQAVGSGITGVARDTSGAVLPGVTVEAASPALIEKVRSAVTDGDGRYNIVNLVPGTYTVTFTLAGFSTTRREGVVLTGNFTAQVNADMQVGSLEETLTVTGNAPLVDTANITQQTRVSRELLEALPTASMGGSTLIAMTPGLTGTASIADVGGTAGYREGMGSNANNASYHGREGLSYNVDGLSILSVLNEGTFSFVPNPLLFSEVTVETGGNAASSGNGLALNAIPQEGGNSFRFMTRGLMSTSGMQSTNLTDEWIRRGIRTPGKLDYHFDGGQTVGGPVMRDKIWFFSAVKVQRSKSFDTDNYFNATQDSVLYTPDLSRPSFTDALQRSFAGRLTWQITQRNKFNYLLDYQNNWVYRHPITTQAPEARFRWQFYPSFITQGTWTFTASSKLLFEAAAGAAISHWDAYLQPEVGPNNVQVFEQSTGRTYGMGTPRDPDLDERYNQRASMTYVTGTHNVKIGMNVEELRADYGIGFVPGANVGDFPNIDLQYVFFNQRPVGITQYARPYLIQDRVLPDLSLFAQDQWALGRLSLNYGLRFEWFRGHVPAQNIAATRFVAARSYERVDDLPNWKDLLPRVGAAYDLFGNGRTALKVNFAKYVRKEGTGIADALNPLNTSVNQVSRVWGDADGDFVPDCDLTNFNANGECGIISNRAFGQPNILTRWSDDVRKGFGVRPANWDITVDLQQQIGSRVSVTAGYNRTWATNFRVTDNLAVTPADFDEFCITAPTNADLPNGGGYEICGLYDVTPAKFGLVDNLVVPASDFGDQKRISNFFNVNVDTRFSNGLLLRGGIDAGQTMTDMCFTVDSPQGNAGTGVGAAALLPGQLHCRIAPPIMGRTQIKLQGSYPLPYDFLVSAIMQDLPTVPYEAIYRATNREIAPVLGRNLAACGARTIETCTATVNVPLFSPGVNFEARRTQVDLRLTKNFRLGDGVRFQANLDAYNVFNSGSLLTSNTAFGPQWRNPLNLVTGRLFQISGQITY